MYLKSVIKRNSVFFKILSLIKHGIFSVFSERSRQVIKYNWIYSRRFSSKFSLEDVIYCVKYQTKLNLKYDIDLDHPKTFYEYINWMKIFYRLPLITQCADKIKVREYIKEKIGEKYLVPAIGIWEKPEDIDFSKLPDAFALKVNWGSGQNIICKNKKELDVRKAVKQLKKWMQPHQNHFYDFFEWGYKNMTPGILGEKYLEQNDGDLFDYKFFCFNGKVKFLFVATNRKIHANFTFFDQDFNRLPCSSRYHKQETNVIPKPDCFEKMKELAEKLAEPFIHVRIDFFFLKGNIYVGEMTFCHDGGMDPWNPPEWDSKLGTFFEIKDQDVIQKQIKNNIME